MPALNLDAALIHATRADERGVCEIASPDHYMDDWFARASKTTIVSADEIVPLSTSTIPMLPAVFTGSATAPRRWFTCPVARTRLRLIRFMATT